MPDPTNFPRIYLIGHCFSYHMADQISNRLLARITPPDSHERHTLTTDGLKILAMYGLHVAGDTQKSASHLPALVTASLQGHYTQKQSSSPIVGGDKKPPSAPYVAPALTADAIAILCVGENDYLAFSEQGKREGSDIAVQRHIEKALKLLREAGVRHVTLMVGSAPENNEFYDAYARTYRMQPNDWQTMQDRFAAIVAAENARRGNALPPVTLHKIPSNLNPLRDEDGLHYTARGYLAVLETLMVHLQAQHDLALHPLLAEFAGDGKHAAWFDRFFHELSKQQSPQSLIRLAQAIAPHLDRSSLHDARLTFQERGFLAEILNVSKGEMLFDAALEHCLNTAGNDLATLPLPDEILSSPAQTSFRTLQKRYLKMR